MRRSAALLFVASLAAAAQGQAPPPASTVQTQPISRVLAGVRQVAGHFGGPKAAAALDKLLADKLGPKGLAGLDLDRPVTGYVLLKPGVTQQPMVMLVPITDRAGALDLLKRAGVEAEPSDADKEIYEVAVDNPQLSRVLLRFRDNVAYVAAFADAADLDVKKLPTAASLTTPNQGAWLLYTTHLDRLTAADRKVLADSAESAGDVFGGLPFPPAARVRFVNYMKVVQRYNALQQDQGKTVTQTIDLDPKTLQFTLDYALTPKPATPLAADIKARNVTDNRFAAVLGPDSVAGVVTKFPLFLPELRDGTAELLEVARDNVKQLPIQSEAFEELEGPIKAALAGLARAAKTGRLDLAAAVRGPNAAGLYEAAAAVSCGGTTELDAEIRKWHANLKPGQAAKFKLDLYKAKGVTVHEVTPGLNLTEAKIWGEKATACVALTETGVIVTFGTEALTRVKLLAAAAKSPKPAPVLDLKVNLKRTRDFALLYGGNPIGSAIPPTAKDELRTFLKMTVAGGDALAVRLWG